jgi:cob(I)alamin adenosyltransferase
VNAQIPDTEMYIQYLNRLSDLLFVAARLANHINHVSEIPWKKP